MNADVGVTDVAVMYIVTHSFNVDVGFTDVAVLYILTHSFMNVEMGFCIVHTVLTHTHTAHERRGRIQRQACVLHNT